MSTDALDVVALSDLRVIADKTYAEQSSHPDHATCECMALKAIDTLLELGYKIEKPA